MRSSLQEWAENIAVYYEGWIGVIREVNIAISARSEQKVSYRMDQKMASHFKDVTDKRKSVSFFFRCFLFLKGFNFKLEY